MSSARKDQGHIGESRRTAIEWAGHQGAMMTTAQAMIVGAVLAWAPSLLVFAWILRDIRNTRGEELE